MKVTGIVILRPQAEESFYKILRFAQDDIGKYL